MVRSINLPMRIYLSVIAATFLLGGCISGPPVATPSAETPVGAPQSTVPGTAAPVGPSTALLAQGRAELEQGNYVDATTSIERALRIDPNNPELWLTLGEIKWVSGDRRQAELMARKALTLSGGDRRIEARANRLLR